MSGFFLWKNENKLLLSTIKQRHLSQLLKIWLTCYLSTFYIFSPISSSQVSVVGVVIKLWTTGQELFLSWKGQEIFMFTSKNADWLWVWPSLLFCEYQVLITRGKADECDADTNLHQVCRELYHPFLSTYNVWCLINYGDNCITFSPLGTPVVISEQLCACQHLLL
jgi:hypothetical protein